MSSCSLPSPVGSVFAPRNTGGRWSRLGEICRCGSEVGSRSPEVRCVECGIICCSICSYTVGSATRCTRCADSLLDAQRAPHAPLTPDGSAPRWSPGTKPSARKKSGGKSRWIILVAHDQSDLFAHLARSFAGDDEVEIILDRRKAYRRNPPRVEERLRTHGAAIVKRPLS